jgi:hypothetical protein
MAPFLLFFKLISSAVFSRLCIANTSALSVFSVVFFVYCAISGAMLTSKYPDARWFLYATCGSNAPKETKGRR